MEQSIPCHLVGKVVGEGVGGGGGGEDEGGGVRLYHPDVVHGHVRHRVQEGHPSLNIED